MLPAGTYKGLPTRNYGILVYLRVANAGLRKVQLQSWKLAVRTGLLRLEWMPAMNMPAVELELGPVLKRVPILGQMSDKFNGNTVVESGCSVSGLAFFNLEAYGGNRFDPKAIQRIEHARSLDVRVCVTDCFGKRWNSKFTLAEKSFAEMNRRIPNIDRIPSLRKDSPDSA
jgi:hypothetical protein